MGLENIDLRSDTLTKPNLQMRKCMAEAVVGDDVYREDPTVLELENYSANLFEKEAALYVPTGTMGNLISVMAHCDTRGQEIILGDESHIHLFEQGGIAQVAGVHHRTLKTNQDGTFNIDELISKIRKSRDTHLPITGLIAVENTHNMCGGTVLPLSFLEEVRKVSKTYDIPVHMDGARIMNAAIYLDKTPGDILKYCDSVSACLSKGLGSPAGTIIAGTKEFIAKGLRYRKLLGGGMRQSGILAAAGLYSLKKMVERLSEDHENARKLAEGIHNLGSEVAKVNLELVQTNMVNVAFDDPKITAGMFCKRLLEVNDNEREFMGQETVTVKVNPRPDQKTVRFVFHADVNKHQADLVVKKVCVVIREFEKTLK